MNSNVDHAAATADARVRWLAVAAALLALAGVGAGAFGAHALKSVLSTGRLNAYDTAVRYQQLHALALFACAWALQSWPSRLAFAAGVCLAAGVVLFCGSLYLVALLDEPRFAIVTPLGGFALLAGWILLAAAVVAFRRNA